MVRMAGWLLAVMLAGGALPAGAAPNDLAGRQSEAEKQQAQLRDRIENLQKDIDTREAARKEAADALKQSESAISRINLRLKELAESSRQASTDLSGLEKQITAQQAVLAKRRVELADQLRTQYTSGLSPWTALLSGDDPQVQGRQAVDVGAQRLDGAGAPTSRSWWPKPPNRRPPWSPSRKNAAPCWRSWKARSPPSAPKPTSWGATTSVCRA